MALRIGPTGEIAVAFPVIHLHNFVFIARRKTLVELVANKGLNTGVVLLEVLASARILSVRINGLVVDTGELWSLAGGARASLDWLRSKLRHHKLMLHPGGLVLALTTLGLETVRSGDQVSVTIDGTELVECPVD